ncbi:efflux transporter outer membrane subunit [candidate division KSB1 bacterium]
MRLNYLLLVVFLLFMSCASSNTNRTVEKKVDIPENWGEEIDFHAFIDSVWWKGFNDPELDRIIEEAFEQNNTFQIAAFNVRSAASQAIIAGAPLLPQADFRFNSSRSKNNFIGLPIPGREGSVLSNTNNSFGVSLNLSWELDLWGKLRADQAAAVAQYQASQADFYGAQLSLAGQVCKAWFAAIEAKRQMELSEATFGSMQLSTEQVRIRYEAGLRGSLDYRLSLANLAGINAVMQTRRSVYENTVRQLEILLGRYPANAINVNLELPEMNFDVPAGLPSDLISRRPDLVAAEKTLFVAGIRIKSAKAALYPSFSLTGSGGTSSNDLTDLISGDFHVWSLAGNVLQPVFNRGRLKAGVELAKSNAEIAYLQYTQTALTAFSEVENALAGERYLLERQNSLETATEQSIAARDLAEEQYSSGLVGFITMLEAQRTAFDNESQLLTVKRERLDTRIDLYLALGGGFKGINSGNDK